jgi:hypothetical protein
LQPDSLKALEKTLQMLSLNPDAHHNIQKSIIFNPTTSSLLHKRERDREKVWTHLLCIPIHSTINVLVEGDGYHVSIVQDAHLGEMATKIVFWIYTTMHICKQEMASKLVFRLHNNVHLRVTDGYKNCLWIMQQCTSAPKDGYKRFVFGLCNMVCTCL